MPMLFRPTKIRNNALIVHQNIIFICFRNESIQWWWYTCGLYDRENPSIWGSSQLIERGANADWQHWVENCQLPFLETQRDQIHFFLLIVVTTLVEGILVAELRLIVLVIKWPGRGSPFLKCVVSIWELPK